MKLAVRGDWCLGRALVPYNMAMRSELKRTTHAQRALGLAELFTSVFAGDAVVSTLHGHGGYRAEMSAPDGPSTGGGKLALQHVRLIPAAGVAGASSGANVAILMGTADPVRAHAELRSYEHLRALHAQRFKGAELPLDRSSYEALLRKVQEFFQRQNLTPAVIEMPVGEPPPELPAPERKVSRMVVGLAVVLVVIALVAVTALTRGRSESTQKPPTAAVLGPESK